MADHFHVAPIREIAVSAAELVTFQEPLGTPETVSTGYGDLHCYVAGDETKKLTIITYHEAGLDHRACFANMVKRGSKDFMDSVRMIHIDAPGQEVDAPNFTGTSYPTIDQLAEQIGSVVSHFKIDRFVGIGVGAGGNIFMRYALANPTKLRTLCIIGSSFQASGWVQWGYDSVASFQMSGGSISSFAADTLLSGLFSWRTLSESLDFVGMYKDHMAHRMNAFNVAKFLTSVSKRDDLMPKLEKQCQFPLFFIYGTQGPYARDSNAWISKMNPDKTSVMEVNGCGIMAHEEHPVRAVQGLVLFLQGLSMALNVQIYPE